MRNILLAIGLGILCVGCNSSPDPQRHHTDIYEFTVEPGKADLFSLAEYRIWIPPGAETIRGVILHQHGCGRDGMAMPFDVHWRALAEKWDCALMGTHYIASDSCATWYNPKNGSEQAFFSALDHFSTSTGHKEIGDAPWVLWGHSGGAFWVTRMLDLHPEKIVAVFPRSGGYFCNNPRAFEVPVMFNYGARERRRVNGSTYFPSGRSQGANWAIAPDQTTGHECGHSRLLAIPFFDACLSQRLPEAGGTELLTVDQSKAWLSDTAIKEIYPAAEYTGNPLAAVWLPDDRIARMWQEFVETGWVTDDTPPEAPFNLQAEKAGPNRIRISWEATADLESGIKQFRLYRNGRLIKRYAGMFYFFPFVLLFLAGCKGNTASEQRPNILFILADDLGYGDLGCYDGDEIETPHIDALSEQGMRFTQFYAASAVCTPTRASVLTGNYPLRFNIRQYFPGSACLPEEAVTLPELIREKGYTIIHIGKWHLGGLTREIIEARSNGDETDPGPLEHGFDHYFSMVEGGNGLPRFMDERILYRKGGNYLYRDDQKTPPDDQFLTDIFTGEAIRQIEKSAESEDPFYINLWYKVPHTPYEPAPEPHLSNYSRDFITEEKKQKYHRGHNAPGDDILYNSMVSNLDANIGRITDRLKKLGMMDKTVIIFTSDNGPSYRGSPGPWTGGKADLHEGGIRMPLIVVWDGQVEAGSVCRSVAHSNDFFPTICDLAGISPDNYKVDGLSMLPLWRGDTPAGERLLFWQLELSVDPWGEVWYPQPGEKPEPYATAVARRGDWKLMTDSLVPVALYNLKTDSLEQENLLGQHPELEDELLGDLRRFFKEPRLKSNSEWFYRQNKQNHLKVMDKKE